MGRDSAAAGLLLLTRAEDGSSERSEAAASGALVVDDQEGTQVGSPPGKAKRLRLGEAHAMVTVQGPACIKFRPPEEDEVRRLSQLRADELANRLLESLCSSADTVGVAQAGGGARGACCLWTLDLAALTLVPTGRPSGLSRHFGQGGLRAGRGLLWARHRQGRALVHCLVARHLGR